MTDYLESPTKSSQIIVLDELELKEKNLRKERINDILASEAELREANEKNGIANDYFKTLRKKETAVINKSCCKLCCDKVCCFFCRQRQRFCGLLIFLFFLLLILFILIRFVLIKKVTTLLLSFI